MSRHFAFVAPPLDGHVNPTLPLVEELCRRGHRVSYATGQRRLQTVEGSGARGVDVGVDPPMPPTQSFDEITVEMLSYMMHMMLDHTRDSLPVLREHFAADPPEAVCYDMMSLGGPMLAEALGAPAVALLPSFAANERFSLMRYFLPEDFDPDHPALREVAARHHELAEQFGVSAPESLLSPTPAGLNLVFVPHQFQPAAETFDERFRFLGPSMGNRARGDSFTPRDEQAPLLFISLGTAFNERPDFYRDCLRAFGDSGWQVAMSIGDRIDPDELGALPDNFDVRPRFPQVEVLRHADVFVSHAGMNSTMESLYHGVPLVTYPQMVEQRANAEQAEKLGLARRLPDDADAATLRKTVDEAAGDEYLRATVTATAAGMRGCGGAVAGVDALEAHLARS
ncbi:glycosyltransferase, MGT family [Actinopolyspora mzabensis]|uniref:Glycosyltransferase, MGT family n=1 Tax=Actinopolyspora mzabensis TaxID=995066 RepID=A0A1G8Y315_ACTMZ|nr:macrolide family glycosyltransferase [Actinopolyspora mzabensis]SDJ96824.1 glycosyltransferase, MGT family [Actinopolyspora mzabensis]